MLLDTMVLERLRRLGGEALIQELARVFLTDAPVRLENAWVGYEEGERRVVRGELHALKGSAHTLGIIPLQHAAALGESLAESGDAEAVRSALEAVNRELERACRTLEPMAARGARPLLAMVEDNADNRLLLRMLLRDRFDLAEYATGPSGLEGMRRRVPVLAILDIALPGMDGTEVLAEMRRDEALRTIPAIALTAHAMPGDRERLLASGFTDYVTKPILDETILLASIERALNAAAAA